MNKFDYYISFNAKSSITSEVEDGENKVIIIKLLLESTYTDSFLVSQLDLFGLIELYLRKDIKSIMINADKIVTKSFPFYAFL